MSDEGATHSVNCWKWHRECFLRLLHEAFEAYANADTHEGAGDIVGAMANKLWAWTYTWADKADEYQREWELACERDRAGNEIIADLKEHVECERDLSEAMLDGLRLVAPFVGHAVRHGRNLFRDPSVLDKLNQLIAEAEAHGPNGRQAPGKG